MLRSQKAVAAGASPGYGPTPPRPYPVSRTVRTVRSPVGQETEIDVEYGTDDNGEPSEYPPGEVVLEQMSSEWWIEGAHMDQCRPPHRRGLKADLPVNLSVGHFFSLVPLLDLPLVLWMTEIFLSSLQQKKRGQLAQFLPDFAKKNTIITFNQFSSVFTLFNL